MTGARQDAHARSGDALPDRLALLGRRGRILAPGEHERRRADRPERVARAPSRRAPRSSRRSPRARPRPASRGSRSRGRASVRCVRGVNQRASTASAIASMPHDRTVAARCSQFSRVPKRAEVQASTRRSMRSGAFIASHIADRTAQRQPAERDAGDLALVEDRKHAERESLDRADGCLAATLAVSGMVVAQHGEVLAERGHLRIPHRVRRAERVREHHDRRSGGALEARVRHRPDGGSGEEDGLAVALQLHVEAIARRGRSGPAISVARSPSSAIARSTRIVRRWPRPRPAK